MDPELRDILGRVSDDQVGGPHTHVTFYGPSSRWNIKSHNLMTFWTDYCSLIDRKMNGSQGIPREPFANLCLAERPQSIMPVICKMILKFHANDDEDWEPYTESFLAEVVSIFQTIIDNNFNLSADKPELMATVLESESYWYEDSPEKQRAFVKCEIKIQFPYAHADTGLQTQIIYPKVLEMLHTNNVFQYLTQQPIGSWDQILNIQAPHEPLALYGSGEVQGRYKLILSHIWPYIEPDSEPIEIPLERAFIPINHAHFQQQALTEEFLHNKSSEKLLPLFLSVGYWPTVLHPKENRAANNTLHTLTINPAQTPTYGMNQNVQDEVISDLELCERLLPILKVDRYSSEPFWLDIGRALYRSDDGAENGVMAWIRHSEKAMTTATHIPDFMRAAGTIALTCRTIYHTFANSFISVKTLAWYARQDNPELYANWHRGWCKPAMDKAVNTNDDDDISTAFYRQFWLDFIYCPIGKGKWFQFKKHRWNEVYQGLDVKVTISGSFLRRFELARQVLTNQITASNDEGFRSTGEQSLKKLGRLIHDLKSVPSKGRFETNFKEKFKHENFINLLDSNPDLMGVTNGVLEAMDNYIVHRAGKPEDYVSMCNNIPYYSDYNWDHPLVVECMKWFQQVYPDPALKHHFLKLASSCLKGLNSDKIFPMMSGNGNNSKSMIVKLFENTFGMYCIKLDFTVVTTRSNNSSGPTPQLARSKSTKLIFIDEPPDDVPLFKDLIKKWVGGDSFFSRFLNDNGGDVKVTFKIFVICNNPPIFANPDQATKDRVKIIPHLAKWVDDAPETEEEQIKLRRFKRNRFFEKRIPTLAPAFLWILTQYFPQYCQEGLVDPPIITESTNTYWRENDMYAQFASDTIQEVFLPDGSRDANARVTLQDIYNEFKAWYKDTFPGSKIPDRAAVKTELSSRWGRMYGNGWNGIRIIANDTGAGGNMLGGGFVNLPVTKPPHGAENKPLQLVVAPAPPAGSVVF